MGGGGCLLFPKLDKLSKVNYSWNPLVGRVVTTAWYLRDEIQFTKMDKLSEFKDLEIQSLKKENMVTGRNRNSILFSI